MAAELTITAADLAAALRRKPVPTTDDLIGDDEGNPGALIAVPRDSEEYARVLLDNIAATAAGTGNGE